MAFIKVVLDEYGIPYSYWKLKEMTAERSENNAITMIVTFDGYFSKETRKGNYPPKMKKEIRVIMQGETPIPNIDFLTALYYQAKQQDDFFHDAIDDIEE